MRKSTKKRLIDIFLVLTLFLPLLVYADLPPLQGNPPPPPGGGGGGGGAPTGSAGGDLGGSYPNPTVVSVADVTLGILTVPNGGTSASTLLAHALMVGNGTSAMQTVAPVASGSALLSAGTSTNPQMVSLGVALDILGATPGAFLQRSSSTLGWAQHTLVATDLPAHASRHNAGGADAMAIDAAAGTGSLRTLGTSGTNACAGNDSRLTNSRTPTAHNTSHESGGSDQVGTATPTANAIPYASASGKLTAWIANMIGDSGSGGLAGLVPAPGAGDAAASKFLKANGTWAVVPAVGNMVGDSGAGGSAGMAPAPPAGSAAAGKVLGAGGTWVLPVSSTPQSIPNLSQSLGTTTLSGTDACLACFFDGRHIWAGSSGGVYDVYDSSTRVDTNYIQSGGGNASDFCFDGTYLWVVDYSIQRLLKIRAVDQTLITTVSVSQPLGCCFDGTSVWVTKNAVNTIVPVNPTTNSIGTAITVGTTPYGCCYDGANIWVCNSGTNTVSQISLASLTVVNTVTVSSNPQHCCFDGTNVWVTCNSAQTVVQIVASTHTVASTQTTASNPLGLCFDGSNIWITCSGGYLQRADAVSGTLLGYGIPDATITFYGGICFDGTFLWAMAADSFSHAKVLVFDPNQKKKVQATKASLNAATTLTSFTSFLMDSDYEVGGQLTVASSTAISTSLSVTYTDVGGSSRTTILPVTSTAGTFLSSGLVTSTGVFESSVLHIRAKGGTTISVQTSAGTFTSVTYSCSACVERK